MRLVRRHSLLFTTVRATLAGRAVDIPDVLVDTGSASTILDVDVVAELGIEPTPTDLLRGIRGVGGTEYVFTRRLDRLAVGERALDGMIVEVGGMDYGFPMNGILGLDFLVATGALLNLRDLSIALLD